MSEKNGIVMRIKEICDEFDERAKVVGLSFARMELAKRIAELEAAQPPAAVDSGPFVEGERVEACYDWYGGATRDWRPAVFVEDDGTAEVPFCVDFGDGVLTWMQRHQVRRVAEPRQ